MIRRLIVPVLLLGVSCSSPLRESSEALPSDDQPAVAEKPAAALPPPVVTAPPPAPVPFPPEERLAPVAPVAASAPPVAEPPPAPVRAAVAVDPVKALLAEEERRIELDQTIARLAAERDAAAVAVARSEKDLLAFKNPFLPRPQLAAEDQAAVKGMGGAARARWAEARVAEAKALLDAAQKAYDAAKANR